MNPLRLVLVTRTFWPLVGEAENVISNLAVEMQNHGARPTIVTAQWEKSWPTRLYHRDVPVVRLPLARQRTLRNIRFMQTLSRWLKDHQQEIDVVMVSGMKHDAYAAIGALAGTNASVVLRAVGAGETGDCRWHETVRFGQRIARRCHMADALIAPTQSIQQELQAAGCPPDRIHHIETGVTMPPARGTSLRNRARHALGNAHDLLAVAEDAPLVVFAGELRRSMGLDELVAAWRDVAVRWPNGKLWLVGEGPHGAEIWKRIKQWDLASQVILPGSFDDMVGVLHASDLFVLPAFDEVASEYLLEAMAAGVPVVATDTMENRNFMNDGEHGRLVPPQDANALSRAIVESLEHHRHARGRAAAAREVVLERFSLAQSATRHRELFEQLISAKANRVRVTEKQT